MAQSSALYQRIRLVDEEDTNLLYPILARYVTDPSTAESVTEVALSPPYYEKSQRPVIFVGLVDDTPIPEGIQDAKVHQAVETYIAELGLSDNTTKMMTAFWQWETSRRNGTLQPDQKEWNGGNGDFRGPGRAFFNTAAILLLSLCKNISTLYFGQRQTSTLKEFLLKANYGTLPHGALQKLQYVEFGAVESHDWMDDDFYKSVRLLQHMQNFHRLPSIDTVCMDAVCQSPNDTDYCIKRVGNMRKLHITRSDIWGHLLRQIIQIPKALEELKLSTGGLMHTDGGSSRIETEDIAKALRQHRRSLKVLDVSFEDSCVPTPYVSPGQNSDSEEEPEEQAEAEQSEEYDFLHGAYVDYDEEARQGYLKQGQEGYGLEYVQMDLDIREPAVADSTEFAKRTIGSLHDFSSMTHLSISLGALLGFDLTRGGETSPKPSIRLIDVLPPNLEYFCVYDYQRGEVGYFDEQMDEFMRQREQFPKLQVVKGVDSMIEDMKIYGKEQEGYVAPERDLGWKAL